MGTGGCCHDLHHLLELDREPPGMCIQGTLCATTICVGNKGSRHVFGEITKASPVYVCRMYTKGCKHAICRTCHSFALLQKTDYAI